MALPTRPVTIRAVSTGASSRVSDKRHDASDAGLGVEARETVVGLQRDDHPGEERREKDDRNRVEADAHHLPKELRRRRTEAGPPRRRSARASGRSGRAVRARAGGRRPSASRKRIGISGRDRGRTRGTRVPIPQRISQGIVPAARASSQASTRSFSWRPITTTRSPVSAPDSVASTSVRSMLTTPTTGTLRPPRRTATRPENERRKPS